MTKITHLSRHPLRFTETYSLAWEMMSLMGSTLWRAFHSELVALRKRRITCYFGHVFCIMSLAACGETGEDTDGEVDTLVGSTSAGPTDGGSGGTEAPTTDGPSSSGGTGDDTDGPAGAAYGLLNFTYYPETAWGSPPELGMAGAWRTEPFTTDDFYAVQAWGMHLPRPPAEVNVVENNDIPAPYEWGKADTWRAGGNALKLRNGAEESFACLKLVQGTFPVYVSDDSELFDPLCAPDPSRWVPGATYDLIAFGGEAQDDAIVPAAAKAPPALTVTAPDIRTSMFPVDRSKGLKIDWEANGGQPNRVVIRLIDTFGQTLTAHAVDDGSFTIPSSELSGLEPGPAILTIAREQLFDLDLPEGGLRVVVRYEVWADPDLI